MKASIKFITPKIYLFGIKIILGCSLWEKKKKEKKKKQQQQTGEKL